MKRLLIGLLAVTSISSFANVKLNGPLDSQLFEAEVFQNKTYYETLGDMFKSGIKPNPDKLIDVLWAGRCFYKAEPNEPKGGGYIFRKVTSDVGPIGRNFEEYEAIALSNRSNAANYVDNMTMKDALDLIKKNNEKTFDKVTLTPTSLVTTYGNSRCELRLSGDYLVLEGRYVSDAGPISKPGEVFGMCYYFIPEYLNH